MGKFKFPDTGIDKESIFQSLTDLKDNDLKWQDGKAFAYIYGTEKETMQFAAGAYQLYLTENGLDPSSFPSLLKLETDVISMLSDLLHGGRAGATRGVVMRGVAGWQVRRHAGSGDARCGRVAGEAPRWLW